MALGAQSTVHPQPSPSIQAVRRTSAIKLDGLLDEPDWQSAPVASPFTQTQPHEGQPGQRTEVRFLYDDDAIYVGARMYDSLGAAGVRTQLVRRDANFDSDYLQVIFDTFHDHLGRAFFTVNPSGVKQDQLGPGGSCCDASWDPVWDVATRIDSLGWTAELRIPLSQLRFPTDSVQTWGLQMWRWTQRTNENDMWSFWHINEQGGPSRFGHLTDLHIVARPKGAEILPYVVGRSTNTPAGDPADPFHHAHTQDGRFGADFKYLLTSNLTLDATVAPDFGQVEVDPAVVNLSAFETFFPEKRPFFVANSGLFDFGNFSCHFCSNVSSLTMFYSRRIGRAPQGANIAFDEGQYADVPDNTSILGAAKITGRTAGGTSIGILDAATRREHASVLNPGLPAFSTEVEPFTNYFVSRIKQDFARGDLQVGGIFTSVDRDLRDSALSTMLNRHARGLGLDAQYWWGNHNYRLLAQFAGSDIEGDPSAILRAQRSSAHYFQRPDRGTGSNGLFSDAYDTTATAMRGYGGYMRIAKEQGDWQWEAMTNFRSPGFEVNDIAFLTSADYVWMNGNLQRSFTKPGSWYQFLQFIAGGQQQYNYEGDLTSRQLHAFVFWQAKNFWDVNSFYLRRPSYLDDRATRGGPVVRQPDLDFYSWSFDSDTRLPLVFNGSADVFGSRDVSMPKGYDVNLSVRVKPASNVVLSVGPFYSKSPSPRQYVTQVADSTAAAFFGNRYVFSDLDQRTIGMDTRLNITFSTTLSLEIYAQPFISSGAYSNFKEFTAPRAETTASYGSDIGTISSAGGTYTVDPDGAGPAKPFSFSDPNFNFRSLRGNAVLRWEYRPGSTVFLVWTQSRSDVAPNGDLSFSRDVNGLFGAHPDNIFLLKVNYWLGM
jgi:hypothetical protein